MTTIAVTEENKQDVFDMIVKRLSVGNLVLDLYDDSDIGTIDYSRLSSLQQNRYDAVDLIDTSTYTDA